MSDQRLANQRLARMVRTLAEMLEEREPLPQPLIRCMQTLTGEFMRRAAEITEHHARTTGEILR